MEQLTILQNIAVVCGAFITIITLVSILVKPIRDMIIERITNQVSTQYEEADRKEFCDLIVEATELNKASIEATRDEINLIIEMQKEQQIVLKQMLANTISHIYHKYINEDGIPEIEKKNLIALYGGYHDLLSGNSYVTQCYEELIRKKVIFK